MWQTGFPFRTRFGAAGADYDPYHHATERLLESGEADALLWVSSFDERRGPPASGVPTVVLGRPGMRFETEPEVYIPVGVPGLDHAGHFFRADKVVALPLRKLRESGLPSVGEVAAAIEAALPGKGG
jgi:formylmethanofuran dehydrogenase subunit B